MKKLIVLTGAALFAFTADVAAAQQLNNAVITGKFISAGGPPPALTGCAALGTAPITDISGACTTSATSGTIVFGTPRTIAPRCIVVDQTATPVAVYAVTTTQITLTTVTSAHVLTWQCFDVPGG